MARPEYREQYLVCPDFRDQNLTTPHFRDPGGGGAIICVYTFATHVQISLTKFWYNAELGQWLGLYQYLGSNFRSK